MKKSIFFIIFIFLFVNTTFSQKNVGRIETKLSIGPGKIKTTGGIEFIWVNGGEFTMGSSSGDLDEEPRHKVYVSSFWIGKYEVTQKQYSAIMEKNPSHFKGDNNPVEEVSWNDAVKFCSRFSRKYGVKVRLPYEAEWEYACCAMSDRQYFWGDGLDGDYCWYDNNSGSRTHPVGQKKPNRWGLYDMSGNVWEWCMDWYDDEHYISSSLINPRGPSRGFYRVTRGGSWYYAAYHLRSARRGYFTPGEKRYFNGFRLLMTSP